MKLSNSSLNTLLACERKFAHSYIAKTPYDSDYVDSKALNFGRAYHRVLERCQHDFRRCNIELMQQACAEFNLDWVNDGAKIAACLRSYFAGFDPNWVCKHMEVWWETANFKGVVDGIFVHVTTQKWRICDLKTVGVKLDPLIKAMLVNNQQMNMYVRHAYVIAQLLGLDMALFDGVTYREVEKPRQRWKPDLKEKIEGVECDENSDFFKPTVTIKVRPETWQEFTQRCGNPVYRDTIMKSEEFIFIDRIVSNINNLLERAHGLKEVNEASQNAQACKQYGSVCPYWSQCYGKIYSEFKLDAEMPIKQIETKGEIIDDADKF